MKAKVIYLSVIILGLVISLGLSRNLYSIYQNSQLVTNAKEKLAYLQAENERLSLENSQAAAPGFIEQQARQALGLVKPGEVVVILPNDLATASAEASTSQSPVIRPVWQQWLGLFFGA